MPNLTRAVTAALSTLGTAVLLLALFRALNLNPGPLTLQVQFASEHQVGAWVAVVALAVTGAWLFVRKLTSTTVLTIVERKGRLKAAVTLGAYTLFLAAIVTGDILNVGALSAAALYIASLLGEPRPPRREELDAAPGAT
ncbi:hypothetical protein [Arthrobacter sp. A2-55]|uniref:hypothetical protein n=1 Tax=Arthrobacter sp. A2-55 TaxID=2897337 RepID=UPI0021CD4E26|nr:hypothetical protein [Arthrobacter sp. A2-55]MCU6481955.1 hypothetical protein [Arthrobacter sp. A2-55]